MEIPQEYFSFLYNLYEFQCLHQRGRRYSVVTINITISTVVQFSKKFDQCAPIKRPRDTIDNLKIETCHHFNVTGEKIFIYSIDC